MARRIFGADLCRRLRLPAALCAAMMFAPAMASAEQGKKPEIEVDLGQKNRYKLILTDDKDPHEGHSRVDEFKRIRVCARHQYTFVYEAFPGDGWEVVLPKDNPCTKILFPMKDNDGEEVGKVLFGTVQMKVTTGPPPA